MSRDNTTRTTPTEVVIHSTRPAVLEAVTDFAATIESALEKDESFLRSRIYAALADPDANPTPAHLKQLNANAELRARFRREVPWLRSADVARLYGTNAAEPEAWKAAGRVFSVTSGDIEQFPLFQFAHGQPIAAMGDILALFTGLSEWQIALWFFAPNAWLDDAAPMDVLQRDPEAVIAAARHAVEPIQG